VRDGAVDYWRDTGICERLARHYSEQHGCLHSDRSGIDRRDHTTASHRHMSQVDYPFSFDNRGRTSDTTADDHIRDLVEQVLFTSPGERVNRPTFGCGLNQLVFAPNSPELAAATQFLVQGALQQWLGDLIVVDAVEVESVDASLRVTISYLVRRTQTRQTAVFTQGGGV
jgi:phage baseplate assembly protein W